MSYKIIKHYLTKNDCYKKGARRLKTTGIVKHSTGANNPYLKRYIDDSERLGKNTGNNHWNMSGISKCVHFMIGKDKNGKIAIYQILPMDYICWGCGHGRNGSYNSTHVQYEICEDGLTDEKYFKEAFAAAAWLDAYICKLYGLKTSSIVSHKEAHEKGYASNHGDCDNWLKKYEKTMDWCRKKAGESFSFDHPLKKNTDDKKEVKEKKTSKVEPAKSKDPKLAGTYVVNTKTDPLALRSGPRTDSTKISSLKKGTRVKCYGYHTKICDDKWLFVSAGSKNGYVYSEYLKKV